MTRIGWGTVGQRFYEAGVDRGVLYVGVAPGVPWNGLTAIKESASGAEPTAYYHDGIKVLNVAAVEEFSATLEAYASPPEFNTCDGTGEIAAGLFATQQPRRPFGLTYRTKIGNDIEGLDLGYKLHFVYNALAAPTSRDNSSLGKMVTPNSLSWSLTTTPVGISGMRPSAHLIVDSRLVSSSVLQEIEDFIYGSSDSTAALPTPAQLVSILGA